MELIAFVYIFFSITAQHVVFTLKDAATAELQHRLADVPPIPAPGAQQKQEEAKNDTEGAAKLMAQNTTGSEVELRSDEVKADVDRKGKENLTSTEEIPSFSEWTQKQLEEAEKKKMQGNISTSNLNLNGKSVSGMLWVNAILQQNC